LFSLRLDLRHGDSGGSLGAPSRPGNSLSLPAVPLDPCCQDDNAVGASSTRHRTRHSGVALPSRESASSRAWLCTCFVRVACLLRFAVSLHFTCTLPPPPLPLYRDKEQYRFTNGTVLTMQARPTGEGDRSGGGEGGRARRRAPSSTQAKPPRKWHYLTHCGKGDLWQEPGPYGNAVERERKTETSLQLESRVRLAFTSRLCNSPPPPPPAFLALPFPLKTGSLRPACVRRTRAVLEGHRTSLCHPNIKRQTPKFGET